MKLNIGDIVGRKSYKCDLLFRVTAIHDDTVELSGEAVRLLADAPLDDIVLISDSERKARREKEKEQEENCYHLFRQDYRLHKQRGEYETTSGYATEDAFFEMRGRVLHVDGDRSYLQKCTDVYNKLGIPVYGVHIKEKEMPEQMESLVKMVRPDILVITGHDAYLKSRGSRKDVKSYRHSKYYADAVREARKVVPHLDDLAIFAGACQSHFESIIKAGANFASSPERINIHALDPVYLVSKVSLTPFMDRVGIWEVLRNTITGDRGIGGVETKGFLRRGMPLQDDID